jgi:hypothetical protein
MPGEPRPSLEGPLFEALQDLARIRLAEDRPAVTGPVFDGLLRLIDTLDELDLGDAPPETGFDPRWER